MQDISARVEARSASALDGAPPDGLSVRREQARSLNYAPRSPAFAPSPVAVGAKPRQGFFASLAREDQAAFESRSIARQYREGSLSAESFDEAGHVHFVTAGVVCLYRTLSDGRRLVSDFAMPGDFIGPRAAGGGETFADALGPVETRRMSADAFSRLLQARPGMARRLQAEADRERERMHERMMLLARFSARERVAAFVVHMQESWRRVNGASATVALPMTRQDIGDFTGLALETVSRMFSEFARERLLVLLPNGLRLLDAARLKSIARAGE